MNVRNERHRAPSVALRPWIEDITMLTAPVDESRATVHPPDTATALVFCTGTTDGDLVVTGPQTRGGFHGWKPVPFTLRVRLRPGTTRPLLGVSPADLVDRAVSVNDLWGDQGRALVDDLRAVAADPARVLHRIEAALDARLRARSGKDTPHGRLVHAAAGGLAVRGGDRGERVRQVAVRLSISERHLRTLFTTEVGLSPKRFARIDRVRGALARAGQAPWAQIATELGYHDQSHLSAEFRATMGLSPGAYTTWRLPAAQSC